MKLGGVMKKISMQMSYLLRHGAEKEGLPITHDGWVDMSVLCRFMRTTQDVIEMIVQDNDKKRFEIKGSRIRALQGHSMSLNVDVGSPLSEGDIPDIVIHGTYNDCLDSILKEGLKRMSRQHIHMTTGLPGDKGVISGMRRSAQVVIYIDAKQAARDGILFYRSTNGVILTSGINGILPPKYFTSVRKI